MILAWPWFALALVLPLLVRFGLPPLRRGYLAHPGFALLRPQAGLPLWRRHAALVRPYPRPLPPPVVGRTGYSI